MTDRIRLDNLTSDQYDQLHDALEHAEATIACVRALHTNGYGLCDECTSSHGVPWPCPTIAALDETAPARPATTQATETAPLVDRLFRSHRQQPAALDARSGEERPA